MIWKLTAGQHVGAALSQARSAAGLTQEEAAEWAGVRRQYVSELEASSGSLQVRRLIDLFAILGYELLVVPAGTDVSALDATNPA